MSDTDTATTTTETATAKRARVPNVRYYDGVSSRNVTRQFGDASEDCDLIDATPQVWDRLAKEGYIHLRKSGASHAAIIAGKAFPDRALPAPKEKRAKRVAAAKEPGPWIKAIAYVKANDLIKAAKSGAAKLTLADIDAHNAAALAWAQSLNKEQVTALRKHRLVRMAHAEITGEAGSLDDVLVPRVLAGASGSGESFEEEAAD